MQGVIVINTTRYEIARVKTILFLLIRKKLYYVNIYKKPNSINYTRINTFGRYLINELQYNENKLIRFVYIPTPLIHYPFHKWN
jgi:hypothetical protein